MSSETHTRSPARAIGCLVVLVMCTSCRDRTEPAQSPPIGPTLQLTLDGDTRTVEISRAVPLATLVTADPASWLEVRADASDGRWIEVPTPTTTYPGSEIRVFLDQGRPALGVFRPTTPDMPADIAALARQPLSSLGPLTSITVLTRRVSTLRSLAIEVDGKQLHVTGDQLATLAKATSEGSRAQGWPLIEVIRLVNGDRELREIRVVGADELTLSGADVRDPSRIHVLKANQRGEYVFRVWDVGGRHATREVRAVTKLVLL